MKVPTGGIVRELLRQQEPAQFRYRQYSLDERRRVWHFAMLFFDAYSLGPVYGVAIQLVKNLLHLPFGSSAGVGELSNFLLGAVFAFIAGIVYKKHKNRGGALWGSVAGAAAMAVISIPINYFIVYPAYVVLYGLPLEAIVGMYQEILGTVAQMPTSNALLNCLMVFNVPFTLCKGLLDVALCFLIYKPLSPLLHK